MIFAAGGTGGHIFTAIAIADEIKKKIADTEGVDIRLYSIIYDAINGFSPVPAASMISPARSFFSPAV